LVPLVEFEIIFYFKLYIKVRAVATTFQEAGVREKGRDKRGQLTSSIIAAAISPASPGSFSVVHGLSMNTVKADIIVVGRTIQERQARSVDQCLEAAT
jgi:hypothetical protein